MADLRGKPTRGLVTQALTVLENLAHRGATGKDPESGDGCGLLMQIPDALLRSEFRQRGIELPAPGNYAVGAFFLSPQPALRERARRCFEQQALRAELRVLGWRDVPLAADVAGPAARATLPVIEQVLLSSSHTDLEARCFRVRKAFERLAQSTRTPAYVVSLSTLTVVYKGLLLSRQLGSFFLDLQHEECASALALVHQRFSTNTQPSWPRAHPYRFIAHNGEINTLQGNVNWMRARESTLLANSSAGAEIAELHEALSPIVDEQGSDSAIFDNALEALMRTGRSLPQALTLMIPPAWEKNAEIAPEVRAYFQYHASVSEPWDGPACIAFTDGRIVGALLDRNGLRPARYALTRAGLWVVASEAGVLDLPPEETVALGRIGPGDMLYADITTGTLHNGANLVAGLASEHPYSSWVAQGVAEAPRAQAEAPPAPSLSLLATYGYHREAVLEEVACMAGTGKEPISSMGDDCALALFSPRPQPLFAYFRQSFAQVTNPAIDPLREGLVMSLRSTLGPRTDLFRLEPAESPQWVLPSPCLTPAGFAGLFGERGPRTTRLAAHFDVRRGAQGLEQALRTLSEAACAAVRQGTEVILLDDRLPAEAAQDVTLAPLPSLLATSAVHQALVAAGLRYRAGLVVACGDAHEVHDHAVLLGFGATALYPWLVWQLTGDLCEGGEVTGPWEAACDRYAAAVDQGLLKIMSKLGISTLHSYRGAQAFEALGLSEGLIEQYFPGTPALLGALTLADLVDGISETAALGANYAAGAQTWREGLAHRGYYRWRRDGQPHLYTPELVGLLQHAVRSGKRPLFERYAARADAIAETPLNVRGCLLPQARGAAVPLEEVEPASNIARHFKTGAMSLGSLSREAHENLAIAMNRIGGKSNSGEGGEDPARYQRESKDVHRGSAIKQVASGRFGVTIGYLAAAEEVQIKISQGAKPGEGGQLPGHKVDAYIATLRFAKAGTALISPPPHHDIYSIEELAQLIYDLRAASPQARITVKLVAGAGVGTIAAGVAKAGADSILISGHSGGTGASPLSSITHAGLPWELGLSDAHHTLVAEDLRGEVRLEADGQLKTPRDVVVAALLGADEFGFGTAALIAGGCVLMRVCHLNTCPVGVATQDSVLRARFRGQPEHVINFMSFMAEGVRAILAELGLKRLEDAVGRADLLAANPALATHPKLRHLNLQGLLQPAARGWAKDRRTTLRSVRLSPLSAALCAAAARGEAYQGSIANRDRTIGTRLSHKVSTGAITLSREFVAELQGAAGQSFGAFLTAGLRVVLDGPANDGCGKGLCGGTLVVRPPAQARYAHLPTEAHAARPEAAMHTPHSNGAPARTASAQSDTGVVRANESLVGGERAAARGEDFGLSALGGGDGGPAEFRAVLLGNCALYGATSGQLFVAGAAGERFAVRNSGADAVVEGLGDHGCEYMTGGQVVVLGRIGRNFGAGMTGGIAYVLRQEQLAGRMSPGEVVAEPLTESDVAVLRALLERHVAATGSLRGKRVLADADMAARFLRVTSSATSRIKVSHPPALGAPVATLNAGAA